MPYDPNNYYYFDWFYIVRRVFKLFLVGQGKRWLWLLMVSNTKFEAADNF